MGKILDRRSAGAGASDIIGWRPSALGQPW
jgi:hypothetical protein